MFYRVFFSILFLAQTAIFSQVTFQKAIGVDAGGSEEAKFVLETADGDFILLGGAYNAGGTEEDALIVKTDSAGTIIWSKSFGDNTLIDYFSAGLIADDGSIYALGYTIGFSTAGSIYLVKFDSDGNIIWEKAYDTASSDQGMGLVKAGSTDLVIASENGVGLKVDQNGVIIWQKKFASCTFNGVTATSDGGFVFSGTKAAEMLLIKVNAAGTLQWAKTYGATGNELGHFVVEGNDGSLYAIGEKTYVLPGSSPPTTVIMKTTSTGAIVWTNAYMNLISLDARPQGAIATPDGHVMVLGKMLNGYGSEVGMALKVNAAGTDVWDREYGANGSMYMDHINHAAYAADGGIIMAGRTLSFGLFGQDYYVVKSDALGKTGGCFEQPSYMFQTALTFAATTQTITVTSPALSTVNVTTTAPVVTLTNNTACAVAWAPITPDFEADQTTILLGSSVNFTDLTASFPNSWQWTFNGGSPGTSNAQNPTGITYNNLGCYDVTLIASNGVTTDTITKPCYIHVVLDTTSTFQKGIGIDGRFERALSVFETTGESFVLSGFTTGTTSDAWVVKTDDEGEPVWDKTFGGAQEDQFLSSLQAADGSIYHCGFTLSFGAGNNDVYVVKTDANGNTLWEKTYGTTGSEKGVKIRKCSGTDLIIATDNGCLIKINASGAILWQKKYASTNFFDVCYTSDGGYIAAGKNASYACLVKVDATGNLQWAKNYTGLSTLGYALSVLEMDDGSYIMGHRQPYVYPFVSNSNIAVSKVSSTGVVQWSYAYSTYAEITELAEVIKTSDGGICCAAQGSSITGVAVKVDADGAMEWSRKFGVNASLYVDAFYALTQATDGGYAFAGGTHSFGNSGTSNDQFYLVKASAIGTVTDSCFQHDANFERTTLTFVGNVITPSVTTPVHSVNNVVTTQPDYTVEDISACLPDIADCVPETPAVIFGSTAVCEGSTVTYTIDAVHGATTYTWSLPAGWSGSSTDTSIVVVVSATGGTVSVSANNACGNSVPASVAVSVSNLPAQPAMIVGDPTVCEASGQTYSVTSDPAASSYTWSIPSGWSGSSLSNTINVVTGAADGNVSVTANNGCGSSVPQILFVDIENLPVQPGAISGSLNPCAGSTQLYAVSVDPLATGYAWTLPSGATGSSSTASISVTLGTLDGVLQVVAQNACGNSIPQQVSLDVINVPGTPVLSAGPTSLCAGASANYVVSPVAGASDYSWSLPVGWLGSSTTTTIAVTAGTSDGTLSVVANNVCGSSGALLIPVTVVSGVPVTPSAITGDASVCPGQTEIYSVVNDPSVLSYSWSIPAGWSGSSASETITLTAGSLGGTLTVNAVNACGSSSPQSLVLTVFAPPTVSLNVPADLLCTYSELYVLSGGSPAGGSYLGTGITSGVLDPSVPGLGNLVVGYSYTDANGCAAIGYDNVLIDDCLTLPEAAGYSIRTYPNPVLSHLNISVKGANNGYQVRFYNLTGEQVLSAVASGELLVLDLDELADGFYLMHVLLDENGYVVAIVKE